MNINLNEVKSFEEGPVFNNGKSGRAVAKIYVERKTIDDKENAPDWNLKFVDKKGRPLTEGFYYPDPTRYESNEKFENHINYMGARLKHFINVLCGDDFTFPVFSSPKEMIDECMKIIEEKNGTVVSVGATYGNVKRPSRWLQVKGSFPVISSELSGENITFRSSDLMERPTPVEKTKDNSRKFKSDLPWDKK